MKFTAAATFLMLASLALPASAQSVANGFYTKGFVELEFFDGGGSSDVLGYANVDFGITPSASGFGFDLGVEAVSVNGSDDAALYGAVSYFGGFGKVQVGVPRPVIDDYLDVPNLGGLQFFDIALLSVFDGSLVSGGYVLGGSDAPLGLRYDGTFGSTTVGASYHSVDGSDVLDLAANYSMGKTTLRGGVEHLRGGSGSETSYFLGAETQFGKINAGVLYSNVGTIDDANALQLYATYKPLDQLELTANVAAVETSGSDALLYGLSADYNFNQGAYVQAGVADGEAASSVYNLSLGLKF